MAVSCLSRSGTMWVGIGVPGYPCPNPMLKVTIGTMAGEMAVTRFRSLLDSFLADSLYVFYRTGARHPSMAHHPSQSRSP